MLKPEQKDVNIDKSNSLFGEPRASGYPCPDRIPKLAADAEIPFSIRSRWEMGNVGRVWMEDWIGRKV